MKTEAKILPKIKLSGVVQQSCIIYLIFQHITLAYKLQAIFFFLHPDGDIDEVSWKQFWRLTNPSSRYNNILSPISISTLWKFNNRTLQNLASKDARVPRAPASSGKLSVIPAREENVQSTGLRVPLEEFVTNTKKNMKGRKFVGKT